MLDVLSTLVILPATGRPTSDAPRFTMLETGASTPGSS